MFDHASRLSHLVMTHVDNIEVGTIIQKMDCCWEAWPPHNCSIFHCGHIHVYWHQLVKNSITHSIGVCKGCISLSSQYRCITIFENKGNCILGTCPLSHYTLCQDLCYSSLSKGVQPPCTKRHFALIRNHHEPSKLHFYEMVNNKLHLTNYLVVMHCKMCVV